MFLKGGMKLYFLHKYFKDLFILMLQEIGNCSVFQMQNSVVQDKKAI